MEGDSYRLYISGVWKKFQPTPSVGRATCASSHGTNLNLHFNPLPPWGGRPAAVAAIQKVVSISIHALRGEGDLKQRTAGHIDSHFNPRPPWGGRPPIEIKTWQDLQFQSTPSVGRATNAKSKQSQKKQISIHALRGEGDASKKTVPVIIL